MSILVLQPTHLDVTICFTNVLLIKASCSSRIHFPLAEIYCCLFFFRENLWMVNFWSLCISKNVFIHLQTSVILWLDTENSRFKKNFLRTLKISKSLPLHDEVLKMYADYDLV